MSFTTALQAPARPDLGAIVREIASDVASWRVHVRFDPAGRYWKKLLSTPDLEVWLLTWLPEHSTELHDHGSAEASFVVVQGVLEETRADRSGNIARRWFGPGQGGDVSVGQIHDVANTRLDPAVSIHAYSPRLDVMNFWTPTVSGLRLERQEISTDR